MKAPIRILNFSISWLMSTISAYWQIESMTAFISATYGSLEPKSERRAITGLLNLSHHSEIKVGLRRFKVGLICILLNSAKSLNSSLS